MTQEDMDLTLLKEDDDIEDDIAMYIDEMVTETENDAFRTDMDTDELAEMRLAGII